ncbi:MAG TPA: DUF3006 domain-containing protein [Longimicrobium sp.]|nr:DUF3006 domain-containing protein [Longimicrobium sp.]
MDPWTGIGGMGETSGPAVRWVVDGIEEGVARVEDEAGRLLHLPAWLLPAAVREGDVLAVGREADPDGAVRLRIAIDRAATEQAMRRSREQVSRLAGGDPGGDIVL